MHVPSLFPHTALLPTGHRRGPQPWHLPPFHYNHYIEVTHTQPTLKSVAAVDSSPIHGGWHEGFHRVLYMHHAMSDDPSNLPPLIQVASCEPTVVKLYSIVQGQARCDRWSVMALRAIAGA